MAKFPERREGVDYLTEGGIETEILYRWGYELPKFAMYPLLADPSAVDVLRGMYRRYLDVACEYGFAALVGGLDYRASPDWGAALGYSSEALKAANLAAIAFLREVAEPYRGELPDVRYIGYLGPRGDAYGRNARITAEEAEDYHAVQLATLQEAEVDLACAMTFNNIPEAIGTARAAERLGVPFAISFSLDSSSRLSSGPTVAEAVATVEREVPGAVDFYGLNCSHPVEFEPALTNGAWSERLRWIRPNAAKMDKIALCKLGHLEEGDPVELGREMATLVERFPQMDIWGGCCGTDHKHLAEIAKAVRAVQASREPA